MSIDHSSCGYDHHQVNQVTQVTQVAHIAPGRLREEFIQTQVRQFITKIPGPHGSTLFRGWGEAHRSWGKHPTETVPFWGVPWGKLT